jgi:hypothetical protein
MPNEQSNRSDNALLLKNSLRMMYISPLDDLPMTFAQYVSKRKAAMEPGGGTMYSQLCPLLMQHSE